MMNQPPTDRPAHEQTMTETDTHLAQTDFAQFVEQVAENNRERDGSNPRYVANHVIIGTDVNEDAITGDPVHHLLFNPGVYFDGERPWPKDILLGCDSSAFYPFKQDPGLSLREIAVDILADAITEYYDEHGWEQGDRDMREY